jgi:hypothetical protein
MGREASSQRLVSRLRALRAHLNQHLFLAAPEPAGRSGRGRGVLLAVALLALAVVLQLFRVGPHNALESLWAEDGPIYLQKALSAGFWHAVTSTYATYLVVGPRLLGELASLFPLRDAPAAIALSSALVVALCGLVVWQASAAHVRDPYLRATLVALTVLCPVAGLESLDSAAYVPWFMLFASFWVLLWRPRSWWGVGAGALLVLLTGLSTPGLWFFAPLALLRLLAARDRRDLTVLAAYAAGAAVQVPVLALNRETAVEPVWTHHIWTDYLQRVIDGAPFGLRLGGEGWVHFGWPLLIVLLLAGLALLAVGLRRAPAGARWIAAIAIPTSLVMFVVSLYQRALGLPMLWPSGVHNGTGSRYAIVPVLLVISAAMALIERVARRRPRPGWPTWAATATIALLWVSLAVSFYEVNPSVRGEPRWDSQLDAAAAVCAREAPAETTVETSPPGFAMAVPCDRLPSSARTPR